MAKRSVGSGLGSLGTGFLTAVAQAVQTGLAAVVGVIVAREFGRTAETDGFFAAYGVFVVLVLAASTIRLVVLAPLARARAERRLGAETAGWALSLGVIALPLVLTCVIMATPLAALLTGFGPAEARRSATDALPWLLVAAAAQLAAGLASSALAALDDYVTSATAYIVGSVAGLAYILVRLDADGITALPPGIALNATIAATVTTATLAFRARRERMAPSAMRGGAYAPARRIRAVSRGIALPLALQAVYLICLPLAAREGVGAVTSFGYAYLAGSAVVAVTAASLALVTAVPLTRVSLDREMVVTHVLSSSWLALVAVAAAAGVFVVAGEPILGAVLGGDYDSRTGKELGRLIAACAPWMVASIGFAVTLPLVFVRSRLERLPVVAVATIGFHIPVAVAGQLLGGIFGLAIALGASTFLALAWLLDLLHVAGAALAGLGREVGIVGALAVAAFGISQVAFSGMTAAVLGLSCFAGLIGLLRPSGLVVSWRYLRALG